MKTVKVDDAERLWRLRNRNPAGPKSQFPHGHPVVGWSGLLLATRLFAFDLPQRWHKLDLMIAELHRAPEICLKIPQDITRPTSMAHSVRGPHNAGADPARLRAASRVTKTSSRDT